MNCICWGGWQAITIFFDICITSPVLHLLYDQSLLRSSGHTAGQVRNDVLILQQLNGFSLNHVTIYYKHRCTEYRISLNVLAARIYKWYYKYTNMWNGRHEQRLRSHYRNKPMLRRQSLYILPLALAVLNVFEQEMPSVTLQELLCPWNW